MLERLKGEPFLLITGDSGVGKSSLCLAGVIPLIVDGAQEDGRRWRSVRLVPGRRPVSALAAALAPVLELEEEALAGQLRTEPTGLARKLRGKLGTSDGLILYVDQLEELVTLASPEEAVQAGLALGSLAEGVTGVRLLATGRSDFLTRLTGVPGLGGEVPRALYLLRALTPEEMREAITGPARVKGVRFESEALVDTLVAATAATEGGLPLLQFALAELWEARDKAAGIITQAALDGLGGVAGALARHADAAVDSLLPDQRVAARGVLLRLITSDGTRARKTARELVGEDARYRAALEALVRARLLVAREAEDGTSYEVAHEALVTGWKTLARWLVEAGERREVQARLEVAAAHWERLGHTRDVLWGTRQLAETVVLDPGELTRREQEFIETSRRTLVRSRRARRTMAAGFLALLVLVYGGGRLRERWHLEEQVTTQVAAAAGKFDEARRERGVLDSERAEAFRLYDGGHREEADALWARAATRSAEVRQRFDTVAYLLERVLGLSPEDGYVKRALAECLYERALLAEQEGETLALDALKQRLRLYDQDEQYWSAWNAPAHLTVETDAPGAELELFPVSRGPEGHEVQGTPRPLGSGPWTDISVAPGFYQLTVSAPGRAPARLPLHLRRSEVRQLSLPLPAASSLPENFVYVPPGPVLFGSSQEGIRDFFNTVPLHELQTSGFLISRFETTFGDWIAYLDALAEAKQDAELAKRLPSVGTSYQGTLRLEKTEGTWRLHLQPSSAPPYSVLAGQKLHYAKRDRRADQDWLKMPVTGISFDDATAYTGWLSSTGRVPGARLCSELEWERAARGVDGREFPHGDTLAPDDANFDLTYGKEPGGFGPDEVGSHPLSRSPFGVDDMAGNVWEWAVASLQPGKPMLRGGGYYYSANVARSSNRELPERTLREFTVGLRVCAPDPSK